MAATIIGKEQGRTVTVKFGFGLRIIGALLLAALAGCNGTAVVTLTTTPSTDTFLTYRVGLVSVAVQTSSGKSSVSVLPSATTVDLAQLGSLSEVLAATSVGETNYGQVAVTVDYSQASIVYDDGSATGVPLTPIGPSGQALGQVTLLLDLDPSNAFTVVHGSASRLSLDFNLAASNVVDVSAKTVTVMPLMAASASPIDSKTVHIRGPLSGANTNNYSVSLGGIMPFDFSTAGAGSLGLAVQTTTTYEINGQPQTGTAGLTQLATVSPGTITEAFGTLTTSVDSTSALTTTTNDLTTTTGTTTTTTTSSTNVTFAASQVLAGSSVQGGGYDRVSGIVTARNGDSLTIEDATLLANDGTNSFVSGPTVVTLGSATQVTQFGSASVEANGLQQISIGSWIAVFGQASVASSGSVDMDATSGRVRLGTTSASGIVTVAPSTGGSLTLDLTQLGGRAIGAFNFAGTGTSASNDAAPASYQVTTAGTLDLTNSTVGAPVEVTGTVTPFGAAPPDFSATGLSDPTTINAVLALDWAGGTPAPFAGYNTTEIEVAAQNSAISGRHLIQIGAQTVDILGIASDPLIVPNSTDSNTVFTIGHSQSGTYENFITFSAFITQLGAELNGTVVATGLTAVGQYTVSTYTFSASSVTLFLDN